MRLCLTRSVLGVGMMAFSLMLCAQGVYVTRGANGPVFSDKPQPGAKEVQLRPLNVVPAQTVPGKAATSPSGLPKHRNALPDTSPEALPPYDRFAILFPENNGSVVANTGIFDIRLAVDPPLRLGEGHAFIISINGQPVGQRFTATEFMVPAEFWGGHLPPINQQAQLDASIVDSAGRVIMRASPAIFFMRYTTVLQRPHRLPPPGVPMLPHYPLPQPPHPPIHVHSQPQAHFYPHGQLPPPPPAARPASRSASFGAPAAHRPGGSHGGERGGLAHMKQPNPEPRGSQ